eukprot:g8321.t1
MADSTASTRKGKQSKHQSAKPYPEFPLTVHPNGLWCKKHKGKQHYFGPLADWGEALEKFKREWPYIIQGKPIPALVPGDGGGEQSAGELTLATLCNEFLNAKRRRVESGDLSRRSLEDYHRTADRMIAHFKKGCRVDLLRPADFERFRAKLATTLGSVSLRNEITRCRVIFKFAKDQGLIDEPVVFGQSFDKPNVKAIRRVRNSAGPRLFEADEIRTILAALNGEPIPTGETDDAGKPVTIDTKRHPAMRAMVLLGVNCGFGNTDVASLPQAAIDWENGWINFPRPKTEIPRRIPLWPETVAAVREAIAERPKPKDPADDDLCFLTYFGARWTRVEESQKTKGRSVSKDSLSQKFAKLLKSLHINGRKGLGFYTLRHCTQTIGGDAKDPDAVAAIMGHVDSSMGSVYRERISEERLRAVTDTIRARGGIDPTILDGQGHPCPKCQGDDRFRAFPDFQETGGLNCRKCHNKGRDGIAALQWLRGITFPEACRELADYAGITNGNGRMNGNGKLDIVANIARRKRVPIESWKAYGAHEAQRGKLPVCRLPMYDGQADHCSDFDMATIDAKFLKGLATKGKPAGLFLKNGTPPSAGETVHVVEGPKDAAALDAIGLAAVGLPTKEMAVKFARLFRGCNVIVIPDRDRDGEAGAQITAARLSGVAASVHVAALPGALKEKSGDGVREILAKRDGEELLRQAIADAVEWRPEPEEGDDTTLCVENGRRIAKGDGETTVPISMQQIVDELHRATGDWPRRLGSALFIHSGDNVAWLDKTAALGGYIGSATGRPAKFHKGVGFHSLPEVFEELRRVSIAYRGVETMPHHPPMEGVYYTCRQPKAGDGSKLRELVSMFSPETDIDSDLILAAFVTPGWGGAGQRPSIAITSDAGRGSGKTTLAKMIGRVWGGRVEVSADESVETIKQRLLSPDGITKRVAVVDNLKSMRFSSAGLEALVTADIISGKRMYVGEASRPNNLAWLITLNGVSFATDFAQRSAIIKLKRPQYSGNWNDDVEAFIDANRQAIIADAIGFLQQPCVYEFARFTRWGNWERDVLSRLPDPAEAQRVITERQGEADAEGEESESFEDAICEHLRDASYSPDRDRVFIPSKLAAEWLSEVTGDSSRTRPNMPRRLLSAASTGNVPNDAELADLLFLTGKSPDEFTADVLKVKARYDAAKSLQDASELSSRAQALATRRNALQAECDQLAADERERHRLAMLDITAKLDTFDAENGSTVDQQRQATARARSAREILTTTAHASIDARIQQLAAELRYVESERDQLNRTASGYGKVNGITPSKPRTLDVLKEKRQMLLADAEDKAQGDRQPFTAEHCRLQAAKIETEIQQIETAQEKLRENTARCGALRDEIQELEASKLDPRNGGI